ncbi:hypothetical protein ACD591_11315 [Rufibacter glacialis]|uniref:Uncharacterized protein n=1 Tax=Rufibacter glacialis TaxID=1259555 RepID=A0A5M8Q9X8_9BACT|nr:hypothetical protein [Rufibacter glacialis]KAA6431660.1 hypothetical protein FOE74_16180 [Rufibacter glacialis]GGK82614.1 hypothetical protein GCM10011405_33010 [Rufibacter glacialis]
MNIQELNTSLVTIIQKKQELGKLSYNDDRYDDVEEELHDLEDEFNDNYGDYLEDVLGDVHLKVCPDTDVLLPTAYLPETLNSEGQVDLTGKQGVWVEADAFPNKEARLVLVPNPTRLILSVGKTVRQEVWKAE